MQLEIELTSLAKETDDASAQRREALERELAEQRERSAAMKAQWQSEKDAIAGDLRHQEAARGRPRRGRARRARRRPPARRRASLRDDPRAREGSSPSARPPSSAAGATVFLKEEVDADDVAEVVATLDRDPGLAAARGRGRQARPHGGAPARARHRPGRGRRGGRHRDPPLARRPLGPRPPDRLVPLPRPDRRRQDRARPRARRVPLRHRGRDRPHRHVRVHGAPRGLAPGRRAARLRRLRRGRPADRGGAPAPLLGRPARRDREGPPRRLQHAARGARRRPPDRRPGPHRRLQERRPDHDLEHPPRPAATLRQALLEHFKPEFINRLDDIVEFEPLTPRAARRDRDAAARARDRAPRRPRDRRSRSPTTRARCSATSATTPSTARGRSSASCRSSSSTASRSACSTARIREGETVVVDARDGEITLDVAASRRAAAAAERALRAAAGAMRSPRRGRRARPRPAGYASTGAGSRRAPAAKSRVRTSTRPPIAPTSATTAAISRISLSAPVNAES